MPLTVEIAGDADLVDGGQLVDVLAFAFDEISDEPVDDWGVAILLGRSVTISGLHSRFFDDPSDTDVMSFPSGEWPEATSGYLGDIAISLDIASSQALEHGHSLQWEIEFLAIHGLLHLLGYDDATRTGSNEMLSIQRRVLTSWYERQ